MTGKSYYITTFAHWKRRVADFTNSHWYVLNEAGSGANGEVLDVKATASQTQPNEPREGARMLVLIEADERTHAALGDDKSFEALPHPLSQRPISSSAQSLLAPLGIPTASTTFQAIEAIASIHPLLSHRVF
jgi:hypothetical protein